MTLIGSGTEANPYLVSTPQDLNEVRNNLTAYYKMTNDIDLKNWGNWTPIGTNVTYFSGTFDGDGYEVKNLTINIVGEGTYLGLFGYVRDGTVKNLGIVNGNISATSGYYHGLLSGGARNSNFDKCYSSGNINNPNGTNIGGLLGGTTFNSDATISNSFSSANVTGSNVVGGFIGTMTATSNGNGLNIINCYSTGLVTSQGTNVGGFNGGISTKVFINNCFWDIETSGRTTTYTASYSFPTFKGLTTTQMKNQSSYTNWDFTNIWTINTNHFNGYPYQIIFTPQEIPAVIEQRSVIFNVDSLSMTAVSRMLTPFIQSLNVEFNVKPIDMNAEAFAKLYTPFVKKIEVTHSVNPISLSAYANLIRVVRKQIEVIHSVNPIDVEGKRLQIKKSIGEIINYVNSISVDTVTINNLAPVTFDNFSRLLESGNEVKVVEHIINNVYINESEHLIHNLQSKTEVTALAFTGDTVTLQVAFKTYDNMAIEPHDVVLKIFKPTLTTNELIKTITLSEENRTGIGKYEYLYTIPTDITDCNYLVAEFSGMYNGNPTLAREKFSIRFV